MIKEKISKMKPWQWAIIMSLVALLVVATIVLVWFYHDAIFTNNTLAITLLCIIAIVLIAMSIVSWKFFRKD